MMRKVDIYYNPYLYRTTLLIDGSVLNQEENRLCEFMEGKPLEAWLDYQVVSYQLWEGGILELMKELNDDELDITFWGLLTDYEHFAEAAKRQQDAVREYGYNPSECNMEYRPRFNPESVKKNVQTFLNDRNTAVVGRQKNMLDMEFLSRDLEEAKTVTVEFMRDVRERLSGILKEILDYHERERDAMISDEAVLKQDKIIDYWKKAVRELDKIYM
ncbi:hypothetical protein GPL15_19035 [Clostridium sp. MCC353]|uniref:hypothetical protein n=1 Tax=Clostridium sp. MCC353 TaxID=2592646 RepID=UPI001C01E17B|nr:hypothetical protein [Clostridium sp. MCC353]MBT9778596.1 hypothetical protein [Clostridium sp. MCC353]